MSSVLTKIALILSFTTSLFACRIWGVIAKSDGELSTLSSREISVVRGELQMLFEQSAYHPSGWAFLGLKSDKPDPIGILVRSPSPASQNPDQYWSAVDALLLDQNTNIGIGHVRMATSGINSIPNPHPWIFQSELGTFSLAHNGTISKSILYVLLTDNGADKTWLNQHPPQTFGSGEWDTDGWNSVVDSELILLLIMKHVTAKKDFLSGIKTALKSLIDKGISLYQTNIVFSDGKSLYVYGGQNGLKVSESSEHYAVMSGPPSSGDAGALIWTGIENGELVILSSDGMKHIPDFTKDDPVIFVEKKKFKIHRAFPNPFNSSVKMDVELPDDMSGTYSVYNLTGEMISDGLIRSGIKSIQWHPVNHSGNPLPSGSYFIRISAGGMDVRQKVLYLK